MRLYLDNGFADMHNIRKIPATFVVVIGGRGTGKTFGALSDYLDTDTKFILMRRTQSQADMINKPEFSPFNSICRLRKIEIVSQSISKYNAGYYYAVADEDGEIRAQGAPIGYTMALSTISNIRGFDASDVTDMVYDEFIPEKHDRPIKNEGEAFLNAYETINRNRELQGEPPVKCLLLANANNMASPILDALGVIDVVDTMQRRGKALWIAPNNTVAVVLLKDSPIAASKRDTVLYRVSKNDNFNAMSLDNDFGADNYEHIVPRVNIAEYRAMCEINGVTMYKHKSKREYYVTRYKSGAPKHYEMLPTERAQWLEKYGILQYAYDCGRVKFADFFSKLRFVQMFQK